MAPVSSRRTSGFTLVEMTIVLGIAGILFGGLWKMLSAGNAQMRDQATANQQLQLASAVSNYLQSSGDDLSALTGGGQKFLKNLPANGGTAALDLPDGGANCSGTAAKGFCAFLPVGFTNATKNPYGQTYQIRVKRDNTALDSMPQTYSFMILTANGKSIPDASGGRISAAMGGDGGFVYSSNVCDATNKAFACGAYGAWKAAIADYGFGSPLASGGYVASRTFYSSSQGFSDMWLARNPITGDEASRVYNTMNTTLYLGGQRTYFSDIVGAKSAGTMYVQNGSIEIANGQLLGGFDTAGTLLSLSKSTIELHGIGTTSTAALETLTTGCSYYANAFLPQSNTCMAALQVNGDANVIGLLQAYGLYATSFIYNAGTYTSSDRRLKTDIALLSNSLSNILQLEPVTYILKSSNQKSLGLIAQDVEKVYPELVTTDPAGYKAVAYDGLIAPLVNAVQELKKENDGLKAQIETINKRQQELEKQLKKVPKE